MELQRDRATEEGRDKRARGGAGQLAEDGVGAVRQGYLAKRPLVSCVAGYKLEQVLVLLLGGSQC